MLTLGNKMLMGFYSDVSLMPTNNKAKTWLTLWNICVTNDHGYVPLVIKTSRSFPIEEEQTTQWPKEKEQKDKKRSTKQTNKTKDRVTRTPLKPGGELRCSGMESSSRSTSDTCRVT
jgi:hypothetical protein